jgi:glutamine amidotransferase
MIIKRIRREKSQGHLRKKEIIMFFFALPSDEYRNKDAINERHCIKIKNRRTKRKKMCRWFVYIGEEPTLLEDILIKPKHSIIKQIDAHFLPKLHATYDPHLGRKKLSSGVASDEHGPDHFTNIDGFGVGYYTGVAAEFNDDHVNRPCVYKNTRPPLNDLNLASLCAHTSTKCVFAHVRAATSLSPTVETNNHPFVFGRYMFMHNGVVANFARIKIALLKKLSAAAYENVFGTTDTEHVAALFFTHLGDDWDTELSMEKLKKAMINTLHDLLTLIRESIKDENEPLPHSSLNFAVANSDQLLAIRFSSMDEFEPPSLYYSTTAGPTLNRKFPDHPDGKEVTTKTVRATHEHGKHAIVASEPNTYKTEDWHLVPPNSFVLIDKDLKVVIEKIQL